MGLKRTSFKLGSYAKHTITGFEGVVVGRTEWLNGCVRYGVQATELKDGKPIQPQWFDAEELEKVRKPAVKKSKKKTGGPMPDPVR